ncbi:glycoside hydrolase superfamily, partial [Ephemerocybe angulata]
ENSMKWDATKPSRGQFRFTQSDAFVEWAVSHNKLIRGHTLVWHSLFPSWVSSVCIGTRQTEIVENHIATVAGRYRSKVYSWDVVNEGLREAGTLRPSVFYNAFITLAFQAARKADPGAVLYINDYNIEADNAKLRGLVDVVSRMNKANPGTVDAIGVQSHLAVRSHPPSSWNSFRWNT